ncbi:uncharacterized protein J3D65DRAFT_195348 [Phyllosticta citribraziliensis]|uniref:Uncharacterized protein n=1 Tax=Phyllosticta citribraziliensis TaxID=989973 RepID=A0ABR1M669_9PEZI
MADEPVIEDWANPPMQYIKNLKRMKCSEEDDWMTLTKDRAGKYQPFFFPGATSTRRHVKNPLCGKTLVPYLQFLDLKFVRTIDSRDAYVALREIWIIIFGEPVNKAMANAQSASPDSHTAAADMQGQASLPESSAMEDQAAADQEVTASASSDGVGVQYQAGSQLAPSTPNLSITSSKTIGLQDVAPGSGLGATTPTSFPPDLIIVKTKDRPKTLQQSGLDPNTRSRSKRKRSESDDGQLVATSLRASSASSSSNTRPSARGEIERKVKAAKDKVVRESLVDLGKEVIKNAQDWIAKVETAETGDGNIAGALLNVQNVVNDGQMALELLNMD